MIYKLCCTFIYWQTMQFLSLFLCFSLVSFQVFAFDFQGRLASIQQLDKADQLAQFEQLLAQPSLSPQQRFEALNAFTMYYFRQSELSNALLQGQITYLHTQQHQLAEPQAATEKLLGIIYYYQGDLNNALIYYQQALAYYEQSGNKVQQANVLNNVALAQSAQGHSQAALASYLKAEPLYLKHGSEYDAVDVRANIAGLYISLRRFDQAIAMLESAVTYYQKHGHDNDLARAQADLGVALKYAGNFPDALARLQASLSYYQQKEESYNLAAALHNIAEVYLLMKLPIKAQAYAEQGVSHSRASDHNKALVGNLQVLAKAWYWRGDALQAQLYLREGLKLADELDYQSSLASLFILNALIEAALEQPEKAIAAEQAYQALERNRFNTELNTMLAESEALQLQQKLEVVQQQKAYQAELNRNKTVEERYLFAALTLLFLVMFLAYKKLRDFHLNKELALQVELQTEKLTRVNQQLLQASLEDGLTGIQNRRSFDADIRKLWQKFTLHNQNFALMFIDIDHFKVFNDKFGHVAGDKVLRDGAQVFSQTMPNGAVVYRYGGEEFAVLIDGLDETICCREGVRSIYKEIQSCLVSYSAPEQASITVSAGTCFADEKAESLNELINVADQRLYQAKRAGRDQLVCQ